MNEFMKAALDEAYDGIRQGHGGPFGSVVVRDGKIVGRGHNRVLLKHDPTSHGEMEAIRDACAALGDWRLDGCSLYVTLEPCPMCAGAIINARISRVVFGAREGNTGSCGSVIDLFSENYGHRPAVFPGVCEAECRELLRCFFQERRS